MISYDIYRTISYDKCLTVGTQLKPPPVILQRFVELGIILHSRSCRGGRRVVRQITTLQSSRDERRTTTCVALAPVTTLRASVNNNYTWGRSSVGVRIRGGERRREERSGRFDRVKPNTSDNARTALRYIAREELTPSTKRQHSTDQTFHTAPTLYVLNPTSLGKPHAIQQLQADLDSNNIEIAVISETWFKSHHTDQAVGIPGYNIFRKDRGARRGGGVRIYITDKI